MLVSCRVCREEYDSDLVFCPFCQARLSAQDESLQFSNQERDLIAAQRILKERASAAQADPSQRFRNVPRQIVDQAFLDAHQASLECPICLEDFEMGSTLIRMEECSHLFHEHCALQWFRTEARGFRTNATCPVCRREQGQVQETWIERAIWLGLELDEQTVTRFVFFISLLIGGSEILTRACSNLDVYLAGCIFFFWRLYIVFLFLRMLGQLYDWMGEED